MIWDGKIAINKLSDWTVFTQMMRYSSLIMSTTIRLWNETEDSLWINLYTIKLPWSWLWLVKLLIIGLLRSYFHIFISLIHRFPRNIHMLNHIMVLILMPFINNITISWNLWHRSLFFLAAPQVFELLKIALLKFSPLGQKLRSNVPTNFLKKVDQ